MATPAGAAAQAVGQILGPLVIEFGGDGLKVSGRKRSRKKGETDNRVLIKRLEIPSPVYLPILALTLQRLLPSEGTADSATAQAFRPPGFLWIEAILKDLGVLPK